MSIGWHDDVISRGRSTRPPRPLLQLRVRTLGLLLVPLLLLAAALALDSGGPPASSTAAQVQSPLTAVPASTTDEAEASGRWMPVEPGDPERPPALGRQMAPQACGLPRGGVRVLDARRRTDVTWLLTADAVIRIEGAGCSVTRLPAGSPAILLDRLVPAGTVREPLVLASANDGGSLLLDPGLAVREDLDDPVRHAVTTGEGLLLEREPGQLALRSKKPLLGTFEGFRYLTGGLPVVALVSAPLNRAWVVAADRAILVRADDGSVVCQRRLPGVIVTGAVSEGAGGLRLFAGRDGERVSRTLGSACTPQA